MIPAYPDKHWDSYSEEDMVALYHVTRKIINRLEKDLKRSSEDVQERERRLDETTREVQRWRELAEQYQDTISKLRDTVHTSTKKITAYEQRIAKAKSAIGVIQAFTEDDFVSGEDFDSALALLVDAVGASKNYTGESEEEGQ